MKYKVTIKATEIIDEVAQVTETLFDEVVEGTPVIMLNNMWKTVITSYAQTEDASEFVVKASASDNLIVMEATCQLPNSKAHVSQIASLEPSDEDTSVQENVSDPS